MKFEEAISEQKEELKLLRELDLACKRQKQIIGRFVSNGFTDRQALYVVVDESPKKYLLRFAWGESPNPNWGREIKLSKKEVQEMILGRDKLETLFPIRN